jgi:hypothetical protein
MEKTKICLYWKNKNCKYMESPEKCCFAHGVEDLFKKECKYGANCYNANCKFNHGCESTMVNMVYDFPFIMKIPKRKNKKINTPEDKSDKVINCLIEKETPKNDNIINKENEINDNHNKIKSENQRLKKVIEKLKNENKNISSKLEKMVKNQKNTIDNMVENTNVRIIKNDTNKIERLYNKYIELYKIFINNSYKNIDLEEIKKYTMDKNIYKVKQRATKIYKFYEKFKNGIIKEILPISKIINMVL